MPVYKFTENTSVTRVLDVEAEDLDEAEAKHANGDYVLSFTDVGLEPGESDWELAYVKEPDDEPEADTEGARDE
jgi:hypothetical protein